MSKVAILRNDVGNSVDPSDLDVLTQSRQIVDALERNGHESAVITCSMDLERVRTDLQYFGPQIVFNLVESLGGTDRLMAVASILLDSMHLPYTGTDSRGILLSGDKLQAKHAMATAGIATPIWFDATADVWRSVAFSEVDPPSTVIVKAQDEHASFELEGDAVADFDGNTQVRQWLAERHASTGRPHLAEEFIPGREFNLSLLEIDRRPQVLAPAEIDFSGLPSCTRSIVGARAKWCEDSTEYQLTPRRFDFPAHDQGLIDHLSNLALRCWSLFGMRGYARVDFRVDASGQPYVLEVNANPCLSQDAGFVAAAEQSRIDYDHVIDFILRAASSSVLSGHPSCLALPGSKVG